MNKYTIISQQIYMLNNKHDLLITMQDSHKELLAEYDADTIYSILSDIFNRVAASHSKGESLDMTDDLVIECVNTNSNQVRILGFSNEQN